MDNIISIFGKEFEYDFLAGWIKYNRLEAGISQEALAHGICSTSHLSYFENGRKRLRSELIEALLKKLKITAIVGVDDIGLIRQKLHKLMFQVEGFDYEAAETTFTELLSLEPLLHISPYNIEFNIYKLMYNIMVERKSYRELENSINTLDRVYTSLDKGLQHLYLLATGKLFYDNLNHTEGINRLAKAHTLKETPWINYRLGLAYCLNYEHLRSISYLEKAMNSYLMSGRYRNSLECHSFLGVSYTFLNMYDMAEFHFRAVLNGSDYFALNKNIFGIYTDLAILYFNMGRYEESITYCKHAMDPPSSPETDKRWLKSAWHSYEQPMYAACIYVEVHKVLNDVSKCKEVFDKYLTQSYENSVYYHYLRSLYLSIFHFDEDIFYDEMTGIILPFYKRVGYLNVYNKVQLLLIKYLKAKRKYKEVNKLYEELLG